jgi:hypothetical protein
MESNLYLYGKGNPVTRTDPSGLYSSELIFKNIPYIEFTHPRSPSMLTNYWWERERWGFFMMLREAKDGNFFQMGYPKLFGQLNPTIAYGGSHIIYSNCDKIFVDYKPLNEFYENEVKKQRQNLIWWRDTSVTHYKLAPGLASNFNPKENKIYIDGAYQTDLPAFRSVSVGFPVTLKNLKKTLEVNVIVDINGHFHLSVGGGPGSIYGVAYTEDYLCVTSGGCTSSTGISRDEVTEAINGFCENQSLVVLTGVNISAICHGWNFDTSVNSISSVSSFYLGVMVGYGGLDGTATIPLNGLPPTRAMGWREIEGEILNGNHLRDVNFSN